MSIFSAIDSNSLGSWLSEKSYPPGCGALVYAAAYGLTAAVDVLLNSGADPNECHRGLSPLSAAVTNCHPLTAARLLEWGAKASTAMRAAVLNDDVQMVALLMGYTKPSQSDVSCLASSSMAKQLINDTMPIGWLPMGEMCNIALASEAFDYERCARRWRCSAFDARNYLWQRTAPNDRASAVFYRHSDDSAETVTLFAQHGARLPHEYLKRIEQASPGVACAVWKHQPTFFRSTSCSGQLCSQVKRAAKTNETAPVSLLWGSRCGACASITQTMRARACDRAALLAFLAANTRMDRTLPPEIALYVFGMATL